MGSTTEPRSDGCKRVPKRERLEIESGSRSERLVRQCLKRDHPAGPLTARAPPSALLGRLQTFLPQLASANEELVEAMLANPGQYSLDIVNEDQNAHGADNETCSNGSDEEASDTGPLVVMDLACGVFDLKTPAALMAAERVTARGRGTELDESEERSEDAASSVDSGSESEDEDSGGGQVQALLATKDDVAGTEDGGERAGQGSERTQRKALISEL